MVNSEFVAVGAETQRRLTDLGVMPKPGGEGEQAKPDYRRQGPMLIEQGDSVVASLHITARDKASGVKTDVRFYPHAKVRDHRIVYIFDHTDRRAALKAVGLAEWAVSQEDVEIVRRVLGPFEQGDLVPLFRDEPISISITAASAPFFTADFECVFVRDDVGLSSYSELDGLRAAWFDWLLPWDSYHAGVEDVIDAGDGRVLVLMNDHACPKGASAEVTILGAPVWTLRDGKVSCIEFYWNRAEGLGAAGLE